jgi:hypothetical protein
MRRAVGVAFESDRRHVDDGRLGQAALQRVVLRLAVAQADRRQPEGETFSRNVPFPRKPPDLLMAEGPR